MTLPSIDGLHYIGCHCNDICACSDSIECIHEECICDRLNTAYQRGREDAERDVFAAEALPFSNLLPRGVATAAARGESNHDAQ